MHLSCINNTQIKLTKEFGQVYSALEALDRDYIQAILKSIMATKETSEGIRKTQEQIKKIVENQRKTLEELKKFKQKLDGYAHLDDIDKIWNYCQKWYQEITLLSKDISAATEHSQENVKKIDELRAAVTAIEKETDDLSIQISQMLKRLESVAAFTSELETITHLQDIDEMWESLLTAHDSLKNISSDIEVIQKSAAKHQKEIDDLLLFIEKVSSLKHLMDVDVLWNCTEEQKLHLKEIDRIDDEQTGRLDVLTRKNEEITDRVSANEKTLKDLDNSVNKFNSMAHLADVDSTWNTVKEHSEQLSEMEKQNDAIVVSVQKNKEEAEAKIAESIQKTNNTIETLTKKIKYAYWIAGGAAGLAIIELLLLLLL